MKYKKQRKALKKYLKAKLEIDDLHAGRDVLVDIEVLDAYHRGYADGLKAAKHKSTEDR